MSWPSIPKGRAKSNEGFLTFFLFLSGINFNGLYLYLIFFSFPLLYYATSRLYLNTAVEWTLYTVPYVLLALLASCLSSRRSGVHTALTGLFICFSWWANRVDSGLLHVACWVLNMELENRWVGWLWMVVR